VSPMAGSGVFGRLGAHVEIWRPYTLSYVGLLGVGGATLADRDVSAGRLLAAWGVPTLGWLAGHYGGDYFDRDLDAAAKPHRPIPSGRVTPRTALACMVGCVAAGGVISTAVNWRIAVVVVAALALGIGYSRWLKAGGLGGNAVRGVLSALALLSGAMMARPLPPWTVLPVAAVFLLHDTASNLVGTIRDVDGDRAGGYRTAAVRYGTRRTLAVVAVLTACWVVTAVLSPLVFRSQGAPLGRVVVTWCAQAVAVELAVSVVIGLSRRPVSRAGALRAHQVLVVARTVLAGSFVVLGAGVALGAALTAAALAVTVATQRMRSGYEFGPDGPDRPAPTPGAAGAPAR
jgi:4-hydroxybenzoate polyprenyltransferase